MSLCAKCQKPLTLDIDEDDYSDNEGDSSMQSSSTSSPQTVPDDVQLSCGDHFHWQCLLDAYDTTKCPSCDSDITTGPQNSASNLQILVNLNNEGGLQEGLDIFDLLHEESYLRAYPEERKSRAFLEFCREGDHKAVIQLLQSSDGDLETDSDNEEDAMQTSAGQKSAAEILRYQDPLGSQQSGLHAAAANGHREVAWLLLLLASEYPELEFPALVFQEAASLGIMREDQTGLVDIRSLRDAAGRTAEDVAVQEGGVVWNGWIGVGRLRIPE